MLFSSSTWINKSLLFATLRFLGNGNENADSQLHNLLRYLEPFLVVGLQADIRDDITELHSCNIHSGPERNWETLNAIAAGLACNVAFLPVPNVSKTVRCNSPMVSPCSPMTIPWTELGANPNRSAIRKRNLALSRCVPVPIT